MWNYALQIPKSLNQDRRSFKTTFTGAGISRSVALSYRKRCFCRFFKHCKSSYFCWCFTGCCISRNICFQASRSRFPTSSNRKSRLRVCAEHQVLSLGFGVEERRRRPPSCSDMKTWIPWWSKDFHLLPTWISPPYGDLGTSFLWRPSDPHPVASWRPPSYADLMSSILRGPEHLHWRPPLKTSSLWIPDDLCSMELWRPPFYGALKTSTLWNPGDLYFMEPWRPPLYGALKTSTLWSPEDIHSMEPWRPLLYGARKTSTLWSSDDLYSAATWRPPLCSYKDLHPAVKTWRPAVAWKAPSYGDLQTCPCGDQDTTTSSPQAANWRRRRPWYLPTSTTRIPPLCGYLHAFILLQHGDFHPAATWTPPPPPPPPPPYSPSSPASICGDLEIFLLRQPRPSPAAASLVTPPPIPRSDLKTSILRRPAYSHLIPPSRLPEYLPNAATWTLPQCSDLDTSPPSVTWSWKPPSCGVCEISTISSRVTTEGQKKVWLWRGSPFCHLFRPCLWRNSYRLLGPKWHHSPSYFGDIQISIL